LCRKKINWNKFLLLRKTFQENIIFSEIVSPEPHEENFLWSTIVGAYEKFFLKKWFIFRPRSINKCKKTKLKSCWTVPSNDISVYVGTIHTIISLPISYRSFGAAQLQNFENLTGKFNSLVVKALKRKRFLLLLWWCLFKIKE
jgi:hypothetical protein